MSQTSIVTPVVENHVDFILLAQFDIDKGSVIKHQYPKPTGVDEQLLAELMLPDGAHKRDDDWTVFFLNRSDADGESTNANKKKRRPTRPAEPVAPPPAPSPVIVAFIYQYSANTEEQGWVMLSPDLMNITLNPTNIVVESPDKMHKFKIEHHDALEYTQLEPLFSCVLIDAVTALGIRFISPGEEGIFQGKVDSMLRSGAQPITPNILKGSFLGKLSSILWAGSLSPTPEKNPEGSFLEKGDSILRLDSLPPTPEKIPEGIFLGKVDSILRAGPQPPEIITTLAGAVSPTLQESESSSSSLGSNNSSSSLPSSPNPGSSSNLGTVASSTATASSSSNTKTPFLYCLNFLNNQKDDTVRRGAVVRALAVCTRHNYIHIYKPFILLALQRYYAHPSEEVLADLFQSLNEMDTEKMPTINYNKKLILRATTDRSKHTFTTSIQYMGTRMNVQLPLAGFPDEVGDYSVISLVQKFGPAVMMIYNAILSEKRVLFLGFSCSAGEVCNYVLAACCMVCPPLTGLIGRVFPYTNLCYLDFLTVPGYITGVTNPMFEEHPEWWDLLCNISTGKVTLNPALVVDVPEKYERSDNELMSEVTYSVSSHYGEEKVRSLFQDYTQHLVDMAFDEEEFATDEERQMEFEINKVRLDSWKRTGTYQNHIQNRELRNKMSAIRDPMVPRYIRKLRKKKSLPESEVLTMYQTFLQAIKTEDQLLEFLSYLPEANGGLYPIAVSLFHSSEPVRRATVELLNRLQGMSHGSSLLSSLNPFLFLAYDRNTKLFNGTSSVEVK
eukprot:Phypoly_transcript_03249.p1 GENE.Phypoly_transcript_03249~~Phypoly_transcript_03249.p1  ORF type:complete len:784 (+),score=142.64 Phypoly_transcript_03249:155-2506(+)